MTGVQTCALPILYLKPFICFYGNGTVGIVLDFIASERETTVFDIIPQRVQRNLAVFIQNIVVGIIIYVGDRREVAVVLKFFLYRFLGFFIHGGIYFQSTFIHLVSSFVVTEFFFFLQIFDNFGDCVVGKIGYGRIVHMIVRLKHRAKWNFHGLFILGASYVLLFKHKLETCFSPFFGDVVYDIYPA